jgi:hypothetical protein
MTKEMRPIRIALDWAIAVVGARGDLEIMTDYDGKERVFASKRAALSFIEEYMADELQNKRERDAEYRAGADGNTEWADEVRRESSPDDYDYDDDF